MVARGGLTRRLTAAGLLLLALAGCHATDAGDAPAPTAVTATSVAPAATPTGSAAASPSPTPSPFGQKTLGSSSRRFEPPAVAVCPTATVTVHTVAELRSAVRRAKPGTVIEVASGTYPGSLTLTAQGTAAAPVFLCGRGRVVLDGGRPTAASVLDFTGARYWRVLDIAVRHGSVGVRSRRSTHLTLQGVTITDTGGPGVWWQRDSTDNVIRETEVSRTGLTDRAAGQGVVIGRPASAWCRPGSACEADESDRNVVMTSTISQTPGSAVVAHNGTYNGVVFRNVFDGSAMTTADAWVDLEGVSWTVARNRGRHSPRDGFRATKVTAETRFTGNTGRDLDRRGTDGVLIALRPDRTARVSCDNRVTDHSAPVSNRPCRR